MILTIEHTGSGRNCSLCSEPQDMKSINIKTETKHRSINRLRLCTPCSRRVKNEFVRAVWEKEDGS